MRFTYTIGSSLYIPLTSRSNTLTLPTTRGTNFRLPAHVVASLCRVRDAESSGGARWEAWCRWLDMQEGYHKLPPVMSESINEDTIESLSPLLSTSELWKEVKEVLLQNSTPGAFSSICFAGEGEPLLRLQTLLELVHHIKDDAPDMSLRVTTNGLAADSVALQLFQSGVDAISVALMTHDAVQYEQLMQPTTKAAFEKVCHFCQASVQAGLKVEVTAVDRPEIDKPKLEALSKELLGAESPPVRWRTYFP